MRGVPGLTGGGTLASRDAVQRTGEISLQDILALEDDASVLDFRCDDTDLPLWPLIRIVVIRMVMSDLLYGTSLDGIGTAPSVSVAAFSTMLRSIGHNVRARHSQRADVCIMSSAVANQLVDGKWFNRITDPFASVCQESTLTIEEPFEWRWQSPRQNSRLRFFAPRQAVGAVVGRLRVSARHRAVAAGLVELVLGRARAHLDWSCGDTRRRQLVDMLARKLASLPTQYRAYESMLSASRPKLLLVTAGCYGPLSPLLAAANRRDIATAELQHGAVSKGHDAYNVAGAVAAASSYREGLPATFLSYGSWWHTQFNAPIAKRAIGNPHRETRVATLSSTAAEKRDLLLLSDGIELALYMAHAQEIAAAVGTLGLEIVLRPHPLERTEAQRRYGTRSGDVRLDYQADLYASLSTAHAVISEVSTGLFEAVGVAEKIFIWDTPKARFAYPSHPFQAFSTVVMLVDLLRQGSPGRIGANDLESVWASGWRDRYVEFLAEVDVRCSRKSDSVDPPPR